MTTTTPTTVPHVSDGLPRLKLANADFVTAHLLVGGDLDSLSPALLLTQVAELSDVGLTHIIDARCEWSDAELVSDLAPQITYLHHGIDDAGQRVPGEWFDVGVDAAQAAIATGGVVLTHCHMGVNRGPSLGYAVLLAQAWDVVAALDLIRAARPIAHVGYAEDALAWHHHRTHASTSRCRRDQARLQKWRAENELDLGDIIRRKRRQGY